MDLLLMLQPVLFKSLAGDDRYGPDDLLIVELEQRAEAPMDYGIISAHPNPFNGQMNLKFNLAESGRIDIALFDYSGRLVNNVFSGEKTAGFHQTEVNAEALASGIYFLELKVSGHNYRQKLTLIK